MNKKYLLNLARKAIESRFCNRSLIVEKPKSKNKSAAFVTLTINEELRGCIGHTLPIQEIEEEIIGDAQAAAFEDPRFPALTKEELDKIKIEISILGKTRKLNFQSTGELIEYLEERKPGVILKKGWSQATFLPQVWEQIGSAEEFLNCLSVKAGLPADEWKKGVEIEVYEVEKFSETE